MANIDESPEAGQPEALHSEDTVPTESELPSTAVAAVQPGQPVQPEPAQPISVAVIQSDAYLQERLQGQRSKVSGTASLTWLCERSYWLEHS